MKTRLITIALAAALSGAAAMSASAGPMGGEGMARHGGPAYMGRLFNRLDANHDGVVTREEAAGAPMPRFDRMDAKADGKVTAEEIDAAITKRLQKRVIRMRYKLLGRLDANGDGIVGRDEFQAKRMAMFKRADLNGDGKVDKAEAQALRKQARRMKRRMMRRMMRGGMMRQRGMKHQRGMMMHKRGMMRRGMGAPDGGE